MSFDEFMNYVRLLANQCWVRYYLHQIPGRMVLELAMAEIKRPEELNRELVAAGFSPVSGLHTFGALHCWRWSVARVERAEGGRS